MQNQAIQMRFISYIFFSILVAIFLIAEVRANADCLLYEPHTVAVTGHLKLETFPGPPNYESVARGDRPEIHWILTLDKPVCVNAEENDTINESEESILDLQMVLNIKQLTSFRKLISMRVRVMGKLFYAHSGHHHKRVLIRVTDIQKAT